MKMQNEFLVEHPDFLEMDNIFQTSEAQTSRFAVLNNLVQNGIGLIQIFNTAFLDEEKQKQYLLQMVEEY